VTQSLNRGWVATLNGKRLRPVELDGWMQGWRLPADAHGTVELRFAPQVPYLLTLLSGLLVAVLTMVAAAVVLLRRTDGDGPVLGERPERGIRALAVGLMIAVLLAVSLPAGAGAALGLALATVGGRAAGRIAGILMVSCAAAAILLVLRGLGADLAAPVGADLLIAFTFGIMAGRVVVDRPDLELAGGATDDV
jgi:arabinofuranan 3-O-arabinosyltransferase